MPTPQHCPNCGEPLRTRSDTNADDFAPASAAEKDIDVPTVPLLAPGSRDDEVFGSWSGSRIVPAEPDPMLGPFVTPTSASMVLESPRRSRSGEGFPAIDLGPGVGRASAPDPGGPADSSDDLADEPERRGTSWPSLLLASYASAITLGLAWTLMKDRSRAEVDPRSAPLPAASIAGSARQGGLSRKVEPAEPLLGDHLAAMGKPLRVGDLEVTPVDVRRQDVTLARAGTFDKAERKAGGKGALVLRLRLKNASADAVFAPLDQAYLRERGKEIVDTFVQTSADERIYPFPLAVESEWSIVGQDFDELRPGESRVVAIVSAPEAPPDSAGPFTWRVRLRTGINRTDAIGLRWPEK